MKEEKIMYVYGNGKGYTRFACMDGQICEERGICPDNLIASKVKEMTSSLHEYALVLNQDNLGHARPLKADIAEKLGEFQ